MEIFFSNANCKVNIGISPDAYRPVDCDQYDYLEIWSMHKKLITFQLADGSITKGIITALFVKDHVEYLTLDHGLTIRLDHIYMANDETSP